MKALFIFLFIYPTIKAQEFTLTEGRYSERWMNYSRKSELNILRLIEVLSMSKTGKKLIQEARNKALENGKEITEIILPGEISLTDTTLVRKFYPEDPSQIQYQSRSTIYINTSLGTQDAVMDLAHELQHFLYRTTFNPYLNQFSLGEFVESTIEGEGGEVAAFLTECMVLRELFSQTYFNKSQCKELNFTLTREEVFSQAKSLFYQVGQYHDQLRQVYAQNSADRLVSKVGPGKIKFISSAYGVPYPLAAYLEYQLVMEKVCENDKKRLAIVEKNLNRQPAKVDQLTAQFHQKCQKFQF
jgi:hypothetical protein